MDYENNYIPEDQQADSQPDFQVEPQAEFTAESQPEFQTKYIYDFPPQPTEEKKKSSTGKIIALALVCSLFGGIAGVGIVSLTKDLLGIETPQSAGSVLMGQRENKVLDITKIDTNKLMTPAEVYAANVNSTVGITTAITTTNFWGYQTTSAAAGSGFILTERDRKSTRLNSSHANESRMPSSA